MAHAMEDLFYYIREHRSLEFDYSALSSIILDCIDFIKVELYKIKEGETPDGDSKGLMESIKDYLVLIKESNASYP